MLISSLAVFSNTVVSARCLCQSHAEYYKSLREVVLPVECPTGFSRFWKEFDMKTA